MKFSEQWLREWVNPALDTVAFAEQLAMIGLTVDAIDKVAGEFSTVVVGEIVTRVQHPNADKLSCCEVNVGEKELLKIVCGAPNARAGIKVVVAKVGAVLPGDFHIKEAKLRGELSQGMLCSAKELQLEMGKSTQEGIIELPKDAPIGKDFRDYFQVHDHIVDVDITPNRGDALSIRGLARDVAAALSIENNAPIIKKIPAAITDTLTITVMDPDLCPRYVGRIIRGVNNSVQTPSFIQHALQRANIRLINPAVDVTNFVMLELGQPMHAYDLSCIKEGIIVRRGKNEKIKLLDEQEIVVTKHDLVIADSEKPLALAGIMGGMGSGVSEQTTDIFLEAAFFTPKDICLSKRRHNTSSDSSHRFERGVDFQNTISAMERATQLILDIGDGSAGEVVDVKSESHFPKREAIFLAHNQIERIIGINISDDNVERILQSLEMQIEKVQNGWHVTPPSFRFDMTMPIDVIEELARMTGYQNIPATPMVAPLMMNPIAENQLSDKGIRQFLVNRAYREAITYSFISPELHALFSTEKPIALKNPMSQDMSVMRTSLLPGLLQAVKMNLNNQQARVRFFETGLCFTKDAQTPKIAIVMTGSVSEEQWGEKSRAVDFYDLKADIASLFHLDTVAIADAVTYLHPGRSCALHCNDRHIGMMGEIHPTVLTHFDIKQSVVVCELDLDALRDSALSKFEAFSRFPSVRRDIAVVLSEAISADHICSLVRRAGTNILKEVHIFDVYQGAGIEVGKKSVALGLTFVHSSRTLRDEEIQDAIHGVITELSRELEATLRT
ncbi:MAG: phenylalanine--tRNA ligase subunit beta [Coxiellaceae bacterium]|nr:phenylalanine--tRNA ligase subunit beta [Coxiellaceae bacterium]